MDRDAAALTRDVFDVLVVGGGINGTGVARDAARRGLKVALVEREDFGYGTTGRSTRLIHGGLRYLALYEFGLVRESLRERERLLRNAPHLVEPIRFLIPIYEGQRPSGTKLRIGVHLYDLLSYDKSLPNHRWLSRDETLAEEPGLNSIGLVGAIEYWDAQVPYVERLCVENALDAAAHGAIVVNHAEVTALRTEGDAVKGATVRDDATSDLLDVAARVVVNAAGPWLADLLPDRAAAPPQEVGEGDRAPVRMTKGVHLFMPRHTENAIVLFSPDDDRLFFDIPWFGQSMVGTTDTDFDGDLDALTTEEAEVTYLLRALHRAFPKAPSEVRWTYAGVRSLLNVEGVDEGEVTRRHLVLDHVESDGWKGLVSIIGGKITPYRLVSEEATDLLAAKLGATRRSDTASAPLPGAPDEGLDAYLAGHAANAGLPADVVAHLVRLFGTRHEAVAAMARAHPPLARRVCEHGPDIWAGIRFAAEREWVQTLDDVLTRRTMVASSPCRGEHVAEAVAGFLQPILGWSDTRAKDEVTRYREGVALRRAFPG